MGLFNPITVSPIGLANATYVSLPNDGADFGPDSYTKAGMPSSTSGIQEALLFAAGSSTYANNTRIYLLPGGYSTNSGRVSTFDIKSTLEWPKNFSGELVGGTPWSGGGEKTVGTVIRNQNTSTSIPGLLRIVGGPTTSASASGFKMENICFLGTKGGSIKGLTSGVPIVDLTQYKSSTTGPVINDTSHELRIIRCTFEDSSSASGALYSIDMSTNQDSILDQCRAIGLPARWISAGGAARVYGGVYDSGFVSETQWTEFLGVTLGPRSSTSLGGAYFVLNQSSATGYPTSRFLKFENCASMNSSSIAAHFINNQDTSAPLTVKIVGGIYSIRGSGAEFFHSASATATSTSFNLDIVGAILNGPGTSSPVNCFTTGNQFKLLRWQSVSLGLGATLNNQQSGVGSQNYQTSAPGKVLGATLLPESQKFYRVSGLVNLKTVGTASFNVILKYQDLNGANRTDTLLLTRGSNGNSTALVAAPADRFYFTTGAFRAQPGTSKEVQVYTTSTTTQSAVYDFESVIEEMGG